MTVGRSELACQRTLSISMSRKSFEYDRSMLLCKTHLGKQTATRKICLSPRLNCTGQKENNDSCVTSIYATIVSVASTLCSAYSNCSFSSIGRCLQSSATYVAFRGCMIDRAMVHCRSGGSIPLEAVHSYDATWFRI